MKKRVYFDTSAVIKEFVLEVGSDLVDEVSNAAKAGKLQIITSAWSINEAIAVIDRLGRRPKDPPYKRRMSGNYGDFYGTH